MPDYYHLREVVTERFFDRHVAVVRTPNTSDLSESELDDVAKKLAENLYQSREVDINTLVVMGWEEVMDLKSEAKARQKEYASASTGKEFTTIRTYPLYTRGTKEGTPAAKKRATFLGHRNFKYGVVRADREHGTSFKIDHYGGAL